MSILEQINEFSELTMYEDLLESDQGMVSVFSALVSVSVHECGVMNVHKSEWAAELASSPMFRVTRDRATNNYGETLRLYRGVNDSSMVFGTDDQGIGIFVIASMLEEINSYASIQS